MPRRNNRRGPAKKKTGKKPTGTSKRGRKPIFTEEQKRVLNRMIREALRDQLKNIVRSL
jgi:hypothetical protein